MAEQGPYRKGVLLKRKKKDSVHSSFFFRSFLESWDLRVVRKTDGSDFGPLMPCTASIRDLYWFVSLNNPYIYQETGRRTNWRKMKIDYFQFPGRVVESERARSLSGRWIYGSTLLSSERWRMWRIYMDFSRSDWMDCIYHEWVNHFGA